MFQILITLCCIGLFINDLIMYKLIKKLLAQITLMRVRERLAQDTQKRFKKAFDQMFVDHIKYDHAKEKK